MKAYTKFELKANMVAFYKQAYENVMSSVQDIEDGGQLVGSIEWTDLPESSGSTPLTFTEALKDSLIAAYVEGKSNFNKEFFTEWEKFKSYLDEEIEKEKAQAGDSDSELKTIPEWMQDLMVKVN